MLFSSNNHMKHYANRRKYLLYTLIVLGVFLALLFAAKHVARQNTMHAVITGGGSLDGPVWDDACLDSEISSLQSTDDVILTLRANVDYCVVGLKSLCEVQGSPLGQLIIGPQTVRTFNYSYGFGFFPFLITDTLSSVQQKVKCKFLPGYIPAPAPTGLNAMPAIMPVMPATNGIIP